MAVPQPIYPILAAQLPEATWLLLPHELGVINSAALDVFREEVGTVDALLVGPGLGREEQTLRFLRGLLFGHDQATKGRIGFVTSTGSAGGQADMGELPSSLVIDADGLNLLAEIDNWWEALPANTILTPHPGEMSRLTKLGRAESQQARFAVVRAKAAEWNCVVVLKGAYSAVAAPDGRVAVSPFATDALATAGTGDVLAGLIVGLMAQGVTPLRQR
jgi:NAD(P)H-hydrate epimerase